MPTRRLTPNAAECAQARVFAGYGVRQAAQLLGCSHAHLSNIENGKCGASEGLLKRMSALYGVEMKSLFTFAKDAA